MSCKWCRGALDSTNRNYSHTVEDYGYTYCNYHCRKNHERVLIENGELNFPADNLIQSIVLIDTNYTDGAGQKVDFKEPYFDQIGRAHV